MSVAFRGVVRLVWFTGLWFCLRLQGAQDSLSVSLSGLSFGPVKSSTFGFNVFRCQHFDLVFSAILVCDACYNVCHLCR